MVRGFENLQGSSLSDSLFGSSGANYLVAGVGDDSLLGRGGNDRLDGAFGQDRIDGGTGNDVFLIGAGDGTNTLTGGDGEDTYAYNFFGDPGGLYTFSYFRNGVDIITDFVIGEDKVWLTRSGFFDYGNYGPTETLRDELFVRNADGLATRGGPQLVQNSTTGVVYYDVDGTGGTAAVTLIQVDPSVALSATDFLYGTSFL